MNELIEHHTLTKMYRYNSETGVFTRIPKPGRGRERKIYKKPVGCKTPNGYTVIMIFGESYLAHRLAFFYMHQRWPIGELDHINRNTSDNRIANLREVDRSTNQHNRTTAKKSNKTGFLGVYPLPSGRFAASIQVLNKTVYLGAHDSPQIAHAAYLKAKSDRGLQAL